MNFESTAMQIWIPIVVAAIVQASFGLSMGVLTLLSGASLARGSKKHKHSTIMISYAVGSMIITAALLAVMSWTVSWLNLSSDKMTLMVLISMLITAGFAVLLFYYRYDPKGTRLWLPRSWAQKIHENAKKVTSARASFLFGASMVVIELVFIVFPLSIAAYSTAKLTGGSYYSAITTYSLLAALPLFGLTLAHVYGAKVASIQRWRENNKSFLQVSSGLIMIMLGIYLLVYQV